MIYSQFRTEDFGKLGVRLSTFLAKLWQILRQSYRKIDFVGRRDSVENLLVQNLLCETDCNYFEFKAA